jgi:hypothetical protein
MRAGALAAAWLAAGCATLPGTADAGRRALEDGLVAVMAPVQVPALAAVEAWEAGRGGGALSQLLLPARFVGFCFSEAGLCALHALDLAASPIHLVAGNGPAGIYRLDRFPMERATPALSSDSGELALYGVGGAAGAAIAYWFGAYYVPHLFHWFTG